MSGCKAKEAAETLVEVRRLVATFAPASALTLTDVTGAAFDDAATREAQTNAAQNAPFAKAGALVGVTGLKKLVYTAVTRLTGRNFAIFDDRREALDWLARQ